MAMVKRLIISNKKNPVRYISKYLWGLIQSKYFKCVINEKKIGKIG